jgi:hypothetical protein
VENGLIPHDYRKIFRHATENHPVAEKSPISHVLNMPPWSEADIRQRIIDRLAELGRPLDSLPDTVRKNAIEGWKRGPTLKTLETVAASLGWSLPELLGVPAAHVGQTDPTVLLWAIKLTANAIAPPESNCPLNLIPEQVATLTAQAYRMIATMAQDRPEVAFSDEALFAVSSHLKNLLANAVSSKA